MQETLDGLQGLPSFQELTSMAKRWLGIKAKEESKGGKGEKRGKQADHQESPWNEQELIEHIAEHIDRHIHQYMDTNPSGRGNKATDKTWPPRSRSFPSQIGAAPECKQQQEGHGNDDPISHGLDGNGDWLITAMPDRVPRNMEPISTPEITTTQPTSQVYSPFQSPTSRCVSPWCEHLGFKMTESPPSYLTRNTSWPRRGYVPQFDSDPPTFATPLFPYSMSWDY